MSTGLGLEWSEIKIQINEKWFNQNFVLNDSETEMTLYRESDRYTEIGISYTDIGMSYMENGISCTDN